MFSIWQSPRCSRPGLNSQIRQRVIWGLQMWRHEHDRVDKNVWVGMKGSWSHHHYDPSLSCCLGPFQVSLKALHLTVSLPTTCIKERQAERSKKILAYGFLPSEKRQKNHLVCSVGMEDSFLQWGWEEPGVGGSGITGPECVRGRGCEHLDRRVQCLLLPSWGLRTTLEGERRSKVPRRAALKQHRGRVKSSSQLPIDVRSSLLILD